MKPRGSPLNMCAVAAVCLLLAVAAGAIEVELTYQARQEDHEGFFPYGHQGVRFLFEQPIGEWKLPPFVSEKPLFATIGLGDRRHLLVLDLEDEADEFYTRLFFDADADGDLTDATIITGDLESFRGRMTVRFERVAATVVLEGNELPYEFTPSMHVFLFDQDKPALQDLDPHQISFQISTQSAYRGTLTLDGSDYDLWLGDANANGRFNDPFESFEVPGQDRILGTADSLYLVGDEEDPTRWHRQSLPQHIVLKDQVFAVEVDIPGAVMRLTPVNEGLAALTFPAGVDSMQVYQPKTNAVVTIYPEGEQAPVPPGDYRLLRYRLLRTEGDDAEWHVLASGSTASPIVTASAGETVPMPLGEPFTPKVTIPHYARQWLEQGSQEARLDFSVWGSGHEIVMYLSLLRGTTQIKVSNRTSNLPAEPAYRIVSAEGEVVASGAFEYG